MNKPTKKNCIECNVEFTANTDKQKFCTNKCCRNNWNKENAARKKSGVDSWKARNPDKAKEIKLKHHYGLTLEQYRIMEKDQNDVCKICKNKCKTGRDLSVDHCHKTGKIRGLLCGNCNYMLGSAQDDVSILASGITYLENSKC